MFDPGQGLPMFSGDDLLGLIKPARALTVNDYEARVVEQRTGKTVEEIAGMIDAVVVTRGGEGSSIFRRGARIDVPCVKPEAVVDPTAAAMPTARVAVRMARDWTWEKSARLASLRARSRSRHRGGQNHRPTGTPSRNASRGLWRDTLGETQ